MEAVVSAEQVKADKENVIIASDIQQTWEPSQGKFSHLCVLTIDFVFGEFQTIQQPMTSQVFLLLPQVYIARVGFFELSFCFEIISDLRFLYPTILEKSFSNQGRKR